MSVRSFVVRLAVRASAVAAFVWGGSALASDVTPVPAAPVVAGAPVSAGEPGCATCQHGAVRGKCDACGKLLGGLLHKDKKAPYPVTLCPGACFGYFQTQWRRWDEACPYPYLGHGVSDAPRPPAGVLNPRPAGSELTPPRPIDPKAPEVPKMPDPKKTGTSGAVLIPVAPNKFAP